MIKEEITKYLTDEIAQIFDNIDFDEIEEIRIRVQKPLVLHTKGRSYTFKDCIPNSESIKLILQKMSNNSYYAFLDEICKGFITIQGGHRVGIAGTPIIENGKVINIKDITSLNIRIAKEIFNCSKDLLSYLPANMLIISPPTFGKTTYLRDLARQLGSSYKISLIDERGEISAEYNGIPQFDVGRMTDVLNLCPKSIGAEIMLRGASPDIIITDEVSDRDIDTMQSILSAGVKVIATAHGDDVESTLNRLCMKNYFDYAVILGKHMIKEVIAL